ncbi:MAG: B12-binding domain-containing radical SAM protein [Candidatus Sumerlaeia bacterium]|nr:B12-binding domain-containing radical SAM protein [Candidatus Sumerlaeia bacterium]
MNLMLVAPASGPWRHIGRNRLFSGRIFRFSLLSLLSVAAETPPDVSIRLVDEQTDDIPWNDPVDLVGISAMTAAAPRAYEIAARFRRHGVPVVLGGMHPTFCSDEAIQHADAVVAGEAEGVWPLVVEDARAGRLCGIYRAHTPPDLARLKRPPRHLLRSKHYSTVHAIQATRGCPHNCAFCSIAAFNGGTQRRRPVADVVAEVAEIPNRFLMFVDDNLTADRVYARSLFEALRPLGKHWMMQTTLAIAEDPDLVGLAAEAGCVGVFVGMETFNETNLDAVNKTCHHVAQYREAVRQFHRHGIGVEAGIIFGFDCDDAGVFARTLSRLDELEIDTVLVSIFTPLPGTPQFREMESRILDRNWTHYDFHHVVFQPRGMSPESLKAGHDWVTREFYRPWRIARRLARAARRPARLRMLPYSAAINMAFLGRVLRWHIRGWNPAAEADTQTMPAMVRPTAGLCRTLPV